MALTLCAGLAWADDVAPVIGTQPLSAAIIYNATAANMKATFTVVATGSSLTYQWQYSADSGINWIALADGTASGPTVAGSTTASLTVTTSSATYNGWLYRCVVTSGSASTTSTAATLTVHARVSFNSLYAGDSSIGASSGQPLSQTALAGGTATFKTSVLSGSTTLSAPQSLPITYQWYVSADGGLNYTAISGASGSVNETPATIAYTTGALTRSMSSYRYYCIVNNKYARSRTTSVSATSTTSPNYGNLTVYSPVTVTHQPVSVRVNPGGTAVWSVAATGEGTLSYQWSRSTDGSTWAAIAGATAYRYNVVVPTADYAAYNGVQYRCTITDATTGDTETTGAATLTVTTDNLAVAITADPMSQAADPGATATFTVLASGTAPFTYQWQVSTDAGVTWSDVSGATDASYTTAAVSEANEGTRYRAVVDSDYGEPVTSEVATLTVNDPPAITTSPVNATLTVTGNTTQIFVVAGVTGTLPLTYQWQVSYDAGGTWEDLVTGTNSTVVGSYATTITYRTPTISVTTASTYNGYRYRCVVSNSAGTAVSSAATLTTSVGLAFTTSPAAVTVAAADSAIFSATARGQGTISYEWQTSSDGSTWSAVTTGIAWSFVPSANTRTMIYESAPVTSADHGRFMRCVISDSTATTVASSSVRITVSNAAVTPTFILTPVVKTIPSGSAWTFMVEAVGTKPISYQWYESYDNATYTAISGATDSVYTTPVTTSSADSRRFRCVATNSAGTATSGNALLTVADATAITVQPTSLTVAAGQDAYVSVTAVGAALTYQWQMSRDGGTSWNTINDATSRSFQFTTVASDDGALLRCKVAGTNGTAWSSAATVTVRSDYLATRFIRQPVAVIVNNGDMATFIALATGTGTIAYQWQMSADEGATWSDLAQATATTYTTEALPASADGRRYRCVAGNGTDTAISNAVLLTVTSVEQFTVSAKTAVADGQYAGENVSVVAIWIETADGTFVRTICDWSLTRRNDLTLWQSKAGTADTDAVMGATRTSHSDPVTGTWDMAWRDGPAAADGEYVVWFETVDGNDPAASTASVVSANRFSFAFNKDGVAASGLVSDPNGKYTDITWNYSGRALAITTQPVAVSAQAGATASFAVAASGVGTLGYQWQRSDDAGATWATISGATVAVYTTGTLAGTDHAAQFRCVVNDSVSTRTSTTATLSIVTSAVAPVIVAQPISVTATVDFTATFAVTASGSPTLTYQWQVSTDDGSTWADVSGATAAVYTTATLATSASYDQYRCAVTNSAGTVTSEAAYLIVLDVPSAPVITTQPRAVTATVGTAATFTVVVTGTAPLTYVWQSSTDGSTWSDVTGVDEATLTVATTLADDGTQYRCVVSNDLGTVTSETALLAVTEAANNAATISFITSGAGGEYAPKHVLAVWLENKDGGFIRTLGVWGGTRRYDLHTYLAAGGSSGSDATMGATLLFHASRTLTWDMTDGSGNPVADGAYRLRIEVVDTELGQLATSGAISTARATVVGTAAATSSIGVSAADVEFTVADGAVQDVASLSAGVFSGISITAGVTETATAAESDTGNCGSGSAYALLLFAGLWLTAHRQRRRCDAA
jgi:hypothetical protein